MTMNRITRTLPILLAVALQIMPLVRNFFLNPAAGSNIAFILRWGIGAGAVVGSVDAVSGATSVFTSPSTFSGSVGGIFSNNVTVSIGGGNKAASDDYFVLSSGSVVSPVLMNGQSTTLTLPPGLTFKASWVNGATTIGGIIYGTPTTAGTYPTTITVVSPGNASLSQNATITISGSVTPTAPAITKAPTATNIIAGKTATVAVTASGTAPLGYFWLKDGNPLANAGNVSGANTATLTLTSVTAADAANYSVIVSNSVNSVTSAPVALTVIIPPAITSQPTALTQAVGSSAQFSVTATGSAPLAYRWLKNGTNLANGAKYSGVSSNTLTVVTLAMTDAGNYSVVITNLAGSITSSVAPLTIVSAPAITTPPANLAVNAGSNASFTVVAAGSAPLTYQWLKNSSALVNGGNISGATTATLNLSAVSASDAASYSVAVSNSLGGVISPAATLTVAIPPAIVTSPSSATVHAGSNASFTVTASGTAPLNYQWFKNSAIISGATNATLALVNVTAADAASYFATVSNAVGSATSGIATLTVFSPPVITAQPTNTTVVQGNDTSFTAGITGTAPLNFQWRLNGMAIPGATSNVLTLASVSTNDAANYSVVATNIVGSVTSAVATLTVLVPPTILTQPVDANVTAGNSASFSVTATGTAPLTYQWRKNGVNLPGATAATLTLATVSATNAGNYSVVIANAAGNIASSNAVLTVQTAPFIVTQPASQFGALGSTVSLSVVATGSAPLSYHWFKAGALLTDTANISGSTSNVLTIAALTTNEVDTYYVVVSNFLGNATSATAAISVNSSPAITTQPVGHTIAQNQTVTFNVAATGSDPLTFQWLKNGIKLANSGTITGVSSNSLTLAGVTTNSSGDYSVLVTNSYGSVTSVVATLTVLVPPAITASPASRSASPGAATTFTVTAKGSAPLSYQWLKNGNPLTDGGNISGSTTSSLQLSSLTTNDAASYSVMVTNLAGSATSSSALLTISVAASRPVILTQPVSQSVSAGQDVEFSVMVSGSGIMKFQWYKGRKTISGATNSTLFLPSVKASDAASYYVKVKNSLGRATSKTAKLVVWDPPVFTQQAASRTSTNGTKTVFKAMVSGTKPISYQWFKDGLALTNGANISGAVSNVLTLANLKDSDAGIYFLQATNVAGSITSSNAVLQLKSGRDDEENDKSSVASVVSQTSTTTTPTTPALRISMNPDGSARLSVVGGQPGATCILEATPGLTGPASWGDIDTNSVAEDGTCSLTDLHAGEHAARFYRVRSQ